MSEQRPFRRPQPADWWARPPYLAYTLRELTGVAVALYGAILLAGLICLWLGPDAYAAYRQALASPWSLAVHGLLLAAVVWHAVTWFEILPKTMPRIILGGKALPQPAMTAVTTAFAAVCSIALIAFVVWWGRP